MCRESGLLRVADLNSWSRIMEGWPPGQPYYGSLKDTQGSQHGRPGDRPSMCRESGLLQVADLNSWSRIQEWNSLYDFYAAGKGVQEI